ncbi:chemotaxis protein CheA [Pseudomonas aeruginosa]|uniref:chemotaxis protein CheA n=1 Tax=Pseudomonas aeruginosa TaxID=287 RepID=UPI0003B9B427|nr:chemotaxis protein CheA [Pseudomonas aeruginosa]EIU2894217.1 chemotaxis protein CheA [Pseudomonas aeruginosa]EIU2920994.1 chemotaxis protein CheA [Pseudomonas aeruginosa]EIU3914281.1 chemotaxis protein CheA [Pseudomonas aeruginosa]EIU3973402.1 chemotaxis protein CheA [Pseudomonas aeruginosa]EJN6720659.1 chemotaxis protein CheA [Pseudomonas aeruginosa]
MPQDMSQFLQVFFEETEEHLATLELLLIGLDLDRPDSETLHGIFRAAHSIKGSSGMFGFDDITAVTHELETLLDRIRCGQMGLRPDMISSFLEARDVLQRLLDAHRSGRPDPGVPLLETVERLRGWLRAPEQEAAEAGFGLFDDAPTSPARETADDDAFGFFDEGPGAPERAAAPEAFGLFDEAPGAPAASEAFGLFDDAPGSPPTEERAFGLFDGAPGSPAAPSAPAQAVAAPARGAVAPVRGDGESGSIRVSVEKIDSLINLVGELVITQAMLGQLGEQLDPSRHERLQHALAQLEHNTRDLQESVMSIRMLPINFIFSRFPRLVRDTATRLGKQVELHLHGEHTELDKSVIEKLSDPLTHIVRNSIDHGIETPAERLAAGKPASGTVKLAASHQGGSVVVEVSDDGRGLSRPRILAKARERNLPVHDGMSDAEVWQLVFMPGFSTAETVTELSGRGVGMDVVKRNIGAMGGRIDIDSAPGMGTRIGIRLPLTLAILDGLIVAVEAVNYVIPLTYIVESLQARSDDVRGLGGEDNAMIRVRGEYLPLFSLHELLRIGGEAPAPEQGIVVILESEGRSFALQVDELVGQQQVVIKSLEQNFRRVEGIAGATIMGDGSVALILDVDALPRLAAREDTADERH